MRPTLKRTKQQLTEETCKEVLRTSLRGVLALNGADGYPYCITMDHYYDDSDGKIYFHSGKEGYKTDCIALSDKACYTVIDEGERKEGEWWLTFRSVVAFGKIERILDRERIIEISRRLSRKFIEDEQYIAEEIENYLSATALLVFTPEEITGKSVREK